MSYDSVRGTRGSSDSNEGRLSSAKAFQCFASLIFSSRNSAPLQSTRTSAIEFGLETAKKRRIAIEDLMKPANVAISDVQTLKAKRDKLFRQFEAYPWKLSLATEIKIIDDQITEESRAKKKARTEQTK